VGRSEQQELTPDYILNKLNHDRESKPNQKGIEVAKPNGITLTRGKYKVVLTIEGKKCHIGYYKTLEDATEALHEAQKDLGDTE
jgi:acetylornithine deacetylase/succinyl-diaminopimelate desuccinylase-like protein